MLRKLKQWYLGFRINSARDDLQVSMLAMRDKVRMVNMHADKLEALLTEAGQNQRTHFMRVETGLARHEAAGHQRTTARHSDLLVIHAFTTKDRQQ